MVSALFLFAINLILRPKIANRQPMLWRNLLMVILLQRSLFQRLRQRPVDCLNTKNDR